MFFRKGFGPGGAKGYEAQINSTYVDPKKTGNLYNFQNVYEQLVPPEKPGSINPWSRMAITS